MSAEAILLTHLVATCRQVRRLSPDTKVAKEALRRETLFAEQLAKLAEKETPPTNAEEVAA